MNGVVSQRIVFVARFLWRVPRRRILFFETVHLVLPDGDIVEPDEWDRPQEGVRRRDVLVLVLLRARLPALVWVRVPVIEPPESAHSSASRRRVVRPIPQVDTPDAQQRRVTLFLSAPLRPVGLRRPWGGRWTALAALLRSFGRQISRPVWRDLNEHPPASRSKSEVRLS